MSSESEVDLNFSQEVTKPDTEAEKQKEDYCFPLSFPGHENMIYFGRVFAYRVPKLSISSKFRGCDLSNLIPSQPDKEIDLESLQKSGDIFTIERYEASTVCLERTRALHDSLQYDYEYQLALLEDQKTQAGFSEELENNECSTGCQNNIKEEEPMTQVESSNPQTFFSKILQEHNQKKQSHIDRKMLSYMD